MLVADYVQRRIQECGAQSGGQSIPRTKGVCWSVFEPGEKRGDIRPFAGARIVRETGCVSTVYILGVHAKVLHQGIGWKIIEKLLQGLKLIRLLADQKRHEFSYF